MGVDGPECVDDDFTADGLDWVDDDCYGARVELLEGLGVSAGQSEVTSSTLDLEEDTRSNGCLRAESLGFLQP